MKRAIIFSLLFAVAAIGSAQKGPDRTEEIWDAVNNRFVRQLDVWFDDGEFPRCVQLLRAQAMLYPDDYDIATNLGWMQENLEKWDEAIASYERYRKQNPKDPNRGLPEAEYYFRKKQYAKIPALLEPTVKDKPYPHPNAFRVLGLSYEKLGKLKDAERVMKKFIALSPNDGAAKNNLRRIQKKLAG